jgi:hypothetical protein
MALEYKLPYAASDISDRLGNVTVNAENIAKLDSNLTAANENITDLMLNKVPKTRTINGKTLENDFVLAAADVNADAEGSAEAALNQAKTYTDTKVSAEASERANAVAAHNAANDAHADIRTLISTLQNKVTTLLDSDDTTLDQMSEVVAYIQNNKSLIDSITTGKVNVSDIVNNLTTSSTNKPLSAAQGVAIKALIDALTTEVNKKAEIKDINVMTGATSSRNGSEGLVPAPIKGEQNLYLKGDGSWDTPINTTYSIEGGTNKITVTPSVGQSYSVDITPEIVNNVTYSGSLSNGSLAIFDGVDGKIKASEYTINSSVPAGAKFTDTIYEPPTYTSYVETPSDETPEFGESFVVKQVKTNEYGHVTEVV